MDDLSLDEMERLHKRASKGTWKRVEYYHDTIDDHVQAYREKLEVGLIDSGQWPAVDYVQADETATICIAGNGHQSRRNADFMAAAHNSMPALLAAARNHERLLAAVEAVCRSSNPLAALAELHDVYEAITGQPKPTAPLVDPIAYALLQNPD